jgi:hypothetical protein
MNVRDIVGDLLTLGKALVPLMPTGTAEIIKAGEATIGIIDKVTAVMKDDTPAELTQTRQQLETQVLQHADVTIGRLGGPAKV